MKQLSESRGATLVSTPQVAGSLTWRTVWPAGSESVESRPLGGRARARSNCSPWSRRPFVISARY